MKTSFAASALAEPAMEASEGIIRKCVHCGFCTATCPTYILLGDELDSPRGRIYLIKELLENQRKPTAEDVKHIDRCLSCLSCMSTCPSDVNYMHLVDHARRYIEENYDRPLRDRFYRAVLSEILPYERRFKWAIRMGRPLRFLSSVIGKVEALLPVSAVLELLPDTMPKDRVQERTEATGTRGRVALLPGCAEPVLKPAYRAATLRLLTRMGFEPVVPESLGCCGAMTHHLGREDQTLSFIRKNVDVWHDEYEKGGLEAIVITASGCGTTVKDYQFILKDDPEYAERAKIVSGLAIDVSEFVHKHGLPACNREGSALRIAYHSACSLQHGQRVIAQPADLLRQAGFDVCTPAEAHLCCGSAGVYNVLQSTIAGKLGERKAERLHDLKADIVASGNVGCAVQLGRYVDVPVVHTVELLDWATGGPKPSELCEK